MDTIVASKLITPMFGFNELADEMNKLTLNSKFGDPTRPYGLSSLDNMVGEEL